MIKLPVRELAARFFELEPGATSSAPLASSSSPASSQLAQSIVYPFDSLPVSHMANGAESRNVLHGTLPTGEKISLHESMQPVGLPPNPAHRIEHSEVILISEGTLEFSHDGVSERVGSGGILFVAFGTLHQVRNAGNVPARYAVLAIGGDA